MTKRIGIIGGGQLGLMIAEEAHRLGAAVSVLDPSPDAPAFAEADDCIVASYDDLSALERLGESTDVLTYEFENVPGDVLRHLESKFNIKQGVAPLFDSQDRLREKNNAARYGLPVPDYIPLPACSADENCVEVSGVQIGDGFRPMTAEERETELREAVEKIGMPCVLKTRRLGYDGHGQVVIRGEEDITEAAKLLEVPCILEAFVKFDYECSVIIVRDSSQTIYFPIGRNIHKDGILDLSIVPAEGIYKGDANELSPLGQRIIDACKAFMEGCDYKGIVTMELFVCGDSFVFNEMAPRPHNSGHYTIEACNVSQYSELCKFLMDIPLTQPSLKGPSIMKNILGQDLDAAWGLVDAAKDCGNASNSAKCPLAWCGKAGDGVYMHIYGKTSSRPKRKMAHVTFVPITIEEYEREWRHLWV